MSSQCKKKSETGHRRCANIDKAYLFKTEKKYRNNQYYAAPPRAVDEWATPSKHDSMLDFRKHGTTMEYQLDRESDEGLSIVSHYSQSPSLQLDSICRKMHLVTQLILVGQNTETLNGIQNLEYLNELWVVEAHLKDADAVSECPNLVKLMLYSNDLTKVPELGLLPKLTSLWLAGNNIRKIENLEGLPELRDLNLANNKISSIGDGLIFNQKLATLNIAKNPIIVFEEMVPLRCLRCLTSLYISDPVYGHAPIARLCNYRSAILLMLPSLGILDGFSASSEEKLQAAEFYEGKLRRLRMLANHYKEKVIKNVRDVIQQSAKDLKHFRDCTILLFQRKADRLPSSGPSAGLPDLSQSIRRWHAERNERLHLIRAQAEIRTDELDIQLQQVGNVGFVEHNAGTQLATICEDLVNRASCGPRLGQYGVVRARVTRVTQVCDRAYDVAERSAARHSTVTHLQAFTAAAKNARPDSVQHTGHHHGSKSSQADVSLSSQNSSGSVGTTVAIQVVESGVGKPQIPTSTPRTENLLLLLTNAERDLRLGSWPLHLTYGATKSKVKEHGLYVTNCLAAADLSWLKRLWIAKENGDAEVPAISERRRMAAIVRLRQGIELQRLNNDICCSGHSSNCVNEDGKPQCKCRCRVYRISGPKPALIFLVEYHYEFKEGAWPTRATCWRAPQFKPGPGVLDEALLTACIGKQKDDWNTVSCINASARGVSVMGELTPMTSVISLDLSYNILGSLGSLYAFPNLRELNLRANNLVTLVNMRTLPNLFELDISWNSIRHVIPILLCLKKTTPILERLKLAYNPVEDVLDETQLAALASHYLPHLQKLDNQSIKKHSRLSYPGPYRQQRSSQPYFPFNIRWRASCVPESQLMPDSFTLNARNRFLKGLSPSEHWSHVRYADLSGNLIDDLEVGYIFNVMINIEEISLARNAIQHLPFNTFQSSSKLTLLDLSSNFLSTLSSVTVYSLNNLRVLDVSNNQLTTLEGLQVHSNLTELYVANNAIMSIAIIQDTLRSLTELKVLDLIGNPFQTERSLFKLALFHLKKLESLNGMMVTDNDLQTARETFGACLDRDAFLRHFTWKDLSHLSELYLPRTGLRSVDLPGYLLPTLVSIDFSNNYLIRLWGLHTLPSLRTLNLADNQIKQLGASDQVGLDGDHQSEIFPSLAILNLQNNGIKRLADLEMERMTALKLVFLQGNRVTDFYGIPPWVTGLVLDRNKISLVATVSPLFRNMSHLTDLLLEGNTISALAFVQDLKSVQKLFIARNRVQDEGELEHLAKMPKLRELTLQGNPVCQREKHFLALRKLLPGLVRLDGHSIDSNFYLLQRQS